MVMINLQSRLIALSVFTLVACDEAAVPRADQAAARIGVAAAAPLAEAAQQSTTDRKLIRTGELEVRVRNARDAMQRADSIVRANRGLITDSRLSRDDNARERASITLRVPADDFVNTINALKTLGVTTSEASAQQDITKAYVDLETRLAVKEQALARLRQLLSNRTGRLSDVLDVEREITRVVTEIEQMKGERRYYDNQIALATIALSLFEPGALRPAATMSISIALGRSLQVLNTSVGWLLYILTFLAPWLGLAAAIWWLVRTWRRRRAA